MIVGIIIFYILLQINTRYVDRCEIKRKTRKDISITGG